MENNSFIFFKIIDLKNYKKKDKIFEQIHSENEKLKNSYQEMEVKYY